MINKLQMMII